MTNREIPDVGGWQPRRDNEVWLKSAFIQQCIKSEFAILSGLQAEKSTSLDAFNSGESLEEIIINELSKLIPKRYTITNGIVSDNRGYTAGHCDLILFNDYWFPYIISGTNPNSRKKYLPVDGAYAIGEIKSTLDEKTLDKACEKLVTASRLNRTWTRSKRLVENREDGCIHGITNPLYTFIIAANIDSKVKFEDLINRFYDINRQLKRLQMIRALCVLGNGVITWAYRDENGESRPARFMEEDLYKPIYPVYAPYNAEISALYPLIWNVHLHLFHSVLAPEDITLQYGNDKFGVKAPTSDSICIQPDKEWLEKLNIRCFEH